MSARAEKVATAPGPRKTGPEAAERRPRRRWKVHVNDPAQTADGADGAESHIPADRLRRAAAEARPLPYRRELEAEFGEDLGGIRVHEGPDVDAALQAEGAEAAASGDVILLSRDADKPVVAHEVAHVLQRRNGGTAEVDGDGAEAEARQVEARVATDRPLPPVARGLPPGAVAFRRVEELSEAELAPGSDREAARDFERAAPSDAAPAPEAGENTAAPLERGSEVEVTGERPAREAASETTEEAGAGTEQSADEAVPTFEPAAMPQGAVDEEAAAPATEEAQAAMEGVEDADGLMSAFRDAPPSVKARHHDRLEGEVGEMAFENQASFEAGLPEIAAEMTGTDDIAAPAPVETPEGSGAALEDAAPPPPAPQVNPTSEPGTANLNRPGDALISGWGGAGDAKGLGRAFGEVSTSDRQVDTSAGAPPEVPLEGASDPQRVADQDGAAREDASARRREATQAVLDGPGPEQVELRAVRESYSMEAREVPPMEQPEGPVEGAAAFREKELDTEVVALFDAHHAESMAASMDEATQEVGTAVETRNTDRDAKVAETEAENARLNAEAEEKQRDEVGARRQEVQDARQTAVDAQAGHVADMEAEADTRRTEAEAEIDDQVTTTERQVQEDFAEAEAEADEEVRAGEREAEQERRKREREAENQSWWDRATDWVAEQFDKLTAFINDVFDAVREAVSDIIDKVKEAALALIDQAAQAIVDAIEALGEALKAAVDALLAEQFPAVAAALNEAIDGAVAAATEVVKAVAEALKAAVSALLGALAAGLDAILAAYQAAVNAALAIARAALTGDWDALAKLVLEPVLMALGIQPAAFYAMIDKVIEALDIIVDDPVGFLSNLIDAFVGGVRRFGENLLTHLQQGIIAWLTGALGGDIRIPERFDLMGVLDLARQILGLTVDMIRRVAVRILGEDAVERIEFVMGYVVDLVTGGFQALWERIRTDLGNLKDMVLEAIRSFLLERVIMAAISWLAGLFSPVGALVKLVMTIWNFLMFLKDQLARLFQVLATIANTMWEIATGVLEPAIQGVESVLGRLLPVAIDLLARLLGLGNVAGRVQEIIGDVRQRIEDAIVNLINRVLSAFTGGRRGGAAGEDEAGGAEDGRIMAPIRVQAGGESHTLSIKDEGETVVPMIRSSPQPLQGWLDGRLGAPFEELAEDNGWEGDEKGRQRTELEGLVTRAKEEEAQLDRAAEEAEDAISEGAPDAATETRETQQEGEETRRALEQVLEFFGLTSPPVEEIFATDIEALDDGVAARFRSDLLPWMQENASEIASLRWDAVVARLASEAMGHARWGQPGLKTAILRADVGSPFVGALFTEARGRAEARLSANEETAGTARPFDGDPELETFFHRYLANDLNQPDVAGRIKVRLLGPGADLVGDIIDIISVTLDAAIGRLFGTPRADRAISDGVSGGNFQAVMIDAAREPGRTFGPYFEADEDNLSGGGTPTSRESLLWFLNTSRRQGRNRGAFSDAIRDANPGQHEWIPGSLARRVIEVTAEKMATAGETLTVRGAFALIRFQHEVRTPTSDLMFRPDAPLSHLDRTVGYIAPEHHAALTRGEEPTQDQIDTWHQGRPEQVGAIQAHAGGLRAVQVSGGALTRTTRLEAASSEWHGLLEQRIQQPLADFAISDAELTQWRDPIVQFVDDTIWRGVVPLAKTDGVRFDYYFLTNTQSVVDYEGLRTHAEAVYESTIENLNEDMEKVLG